MSVRVNRYQTTKQRRQNHNTKANDLPHHNKRERAVMDTSTSISSVSSSNTHSLVTAATVRPLLSVEQLTDVRDTLKGPPLTDRSVLIPFGRKAFLPGRLQPLCLSNDNVDTASESLTTSTKNSSDDIAKKQEILMVHDVVSTHGRIDDASRVIHTENGSSTASSVQMTRQEALDYLQQEIDHLKKQTSTQRQSPTGTRKTTGNTEKQTTANDVALNALPYIEIREELDDTGNVITGQAVDVTKHLNYLSQQQQQPTQETKSVMSDEMETVQPKSLLSENVAKVTTSVDTTDDDSDILQIGLTTETIPQQRVSDEQYDSISRRLEELMLLEERHEQKFNTSPVPISSRKASEQQSSKNKGWAKGFLNQPTKKKSTPTMKQAPLQMNSDVPVQLSTNSSVDPGQAPSLLSKDHDNDVGVSNKKVSFTGQDHVQEIPRIGQRSIASELQQQKQQQQHPQRSFMMPTNRIPTTFTSLDSMKSSAIAPQVVEKKQPSTRRRPVAPTTTPSQLIANDVDARTTRIHNDEVTSTPIVLPEPPTRKLSRFAQERQQMRN